MNRVTRWFRESVTPPAHRWRWPIFLASAAGVVVLAWFDHLATDAIRFDAGYFALVALVAWYTGPTSASAVAALAVTLGIIPDLERFPDTSVGTILWNSAATLVVYLAAVFVLSALRSSWVEQQQAARTDPLTGLLNRRALQDVLAGEVQRSRRYGTSFAFAYVDLDGFKELNDRYGHEAGDRALTIVGRTLSEGLRTSDIVARLGGDEFAVLLPETSLEGAVTLVERVLGSLAPTLSAEGWSGVSASAGVHAPGVEPPGPDEVIRRADDLMYEAKQAGRNQIRAAGAGSEASEPA